TRRAGLHPGPCPLLAADTVVAASGTILEKPASREHAREMLEMLSGRTHQVVTGVAFVAGAIDASGSWLSVAAADAAVARFCESHVTFASLSVAEIEAYLDSDEWRGVAGGYRIQGLAARHITALSGSYSNVVGLPLNLVYSILTGQPGN
ncbi:MAG: Maf family protein, partial [Spirochaetota bacterium]